MAGMNLIGWKLRDIMRVRRLTQRELGEIYGVDQPTISRALHNRRIPKSFSDQIDAEYVRLFGSHAAPQNALPASLAMRMERLTVEQLDKIFETIDNLLQVAESSSD